MEMVACPKCSGKVDSTWSKCPYCGASLETSFVSSLLGFFGGGKEKTSRNGPPDHQNADASDRNPSSSSLASVFRFVVEDVFSIKGRGTVVTGKTEGSVLHLGESLRFEGEGKGNQVYKVKGIESFRKVHKSAEPGMNVGLLLSGMEKDDVTRGDVLIRVE